MTPSIPAPRVTLSRDGGPVSARVENFDLGSSLGQSLGHRIGAVVVGRDDDALADEDSVSTEIDERRVGRHHARPVVVGDDERPFDRAGRDDDFSWPDAPQRVGQRRPPLPGADEIAVIDAIGRRSRHHPAAGGFDRLHDARRPFAPVSAVDRPAAMGELAADLGVVVDEENRASRERGRVGRGKSGCSRADDEEIAAGVELRIVGRRAVVGRRFGRGRPWRESRPRRSPTAARGTSCSRSPPAGTARACRGGRRDRRPPSAPH